MWICTSQIQFSVSLMTFMNKHSHIRWVANSGTVFVRLLQLITSPEWLCSLDQRLTNSWSWFLCLWQDRANGAGRCAHRGRFPRSLGCPQAFCTEAQFCKQVLGQVCEDSVTSPSLYSRWEFPFHFVWQRKLKKSINRLPKTSLTGLQSEAQSPQY